MTEQEVLIAVHKYMSGEMTKPEPFANWTTFEDLIIIWTKDDQRYDLTVTKNEGRKKAFT